MRREGLVTAMLVVAALAWALGTPVLGYGSMIAAAPFFGDVPTPAEQAAATRLAVAAAGCGFAAPLVGLVVALSTRRRTAAIVFAVALGLSIAAVAALFSG